jgi:hypothetical protein
VADSHQQRRSEISSSVIKSGAPYKKISRKSAAADLKKTRFLYGKSAAPSAAP